MKSPYDILGVSPDASEEDIKKAYRNLSRRYHPDANVNNPNKEQAEERFKEVQQAYQAIMDGNTGGYGSANGYAGNGYGSFRGFGEGYRQRIISGDEIISLHSGFCLILKIKMENGIIFRQLPIRVWVIRQEL